MQKWSTVQSEIFTVLFPQILQVEPSRKFQLLHMPIYSNMDISKIAKLAPHELWHVVQNHESNCMQKYTVNSCLD